MPTPKATRPAPATANPGQPAEPEIRSLPADFWLAGPPPRLLWQTVGTGAMRIAYARPLPEMLS